MIDEIIEGLPKVLLAILFTFGLCGYVWRVTETYD